MARPRSEEAREAALEATVELVLERGVEGVTFEDVATRSGVA
jgi:AcrR family transcriptional regulator